MPASAALMQRVAAVRKRLSGLTDARVKLCAEMVSGEGQVGGDPAWSAALSSSMS